MTSHRTCPSLMLSSSLLNPFDDDSEMSVSSLALHSHMPPIRQIYSRICIWTFLGPLLPTASKLPALPTMPVRVDFSGSSMPRLPQKHHTHSVPPAAAKVKWPLSRSLARQQVSATALQAAMAPTAPNLPRSQVPLHMTFPHCACNL